MSITEQIKVLDAGWISSSESNGVRTTMKNADLIALAESHERLLVLARAYRDTLLGEYEGRNGIAHEVKEEYYRTLAAIEEAEKI